MVKAFAMTNLGYDADLIVHFQEGHSTVLKMKYDELKELALLSAAMLSRIDEDMRADAQAAAAAERFEDLDFLDRSGNL